jgi:hypothetical protein
MSKKVEMPEYLLIKNPISGKHVNILPMLVLLEDNYAGLEGSFDNFIKPLQEMQDFLSTCVPFEKLEKPSLSELGNVSYNIVRLRKMFEEMSEPI